MSINYKGLMVSFEEDISDEGIGLLLDAIQMIKGVQNVKPVEANSDDWMNRDRIRHEFKMKIYDFAKEL